VTGPIQPLRCRAACYTAFGQALAHLSEPGGLLRAASTIALHEHPSADLDLIEARVEGLAGQVRAVAQGRSQKARLALLHRVLFEEHDFQGDEQTYANPSNSYFNTILATRRGLPITLALLYVDVARRVGIVAHGLDAPAHFLVEVEEPDGLLIVDPFHRGTALTRAELMARLERALGRPLPPDAHVARATPAGWLDRILRNLEGSFARAARMEDYAAMGELRALLKAS
jgi:regulator of sirC expression with transglutaminase-like and TPR domain